MTSLPPRLIPERAFPKYIFIPGVNPHPKKVGGYRCGIPEPISQKVNPENPMSSDDLKYALDLFNFGYFWESHVYFEALWNAHGRVGSVSDFFKAMIKLGAAGVKDSIGQDKNAQDHRERAKELFTQVSEVEGTRFMGFDLEEIINDVTEKSIIHVTFTTEGHGPSLG